MSFTQQGPHFRRFAARSAASLAMLVAASIVSMPLAFTPIASAQLAPISVRRPSHRTADPVAARADSLAATGDTTGALTYLESVLYPHSTNAAAWHRYGVIQWQRAASGRAGGYIRSAKVIATLQLADSALRLATRFAPDSAEYWTTLGRFNLQSNVASMRFSASQQMERAYQAASRVGDSAFIAQGADETGLAIWRRYETTANRALITDGKHVQLQTIMHWQRGRALDYLDTFAKRIEPPTGKTDFTLALERFRIAEAVEPSNLRYSRHMFMALAEGRRWDELLALATKRAINSPFDAQARFARGLALQRLGRGPEANAVFDSARNMLDDEERNRLFALRRILPPAANVLTGARTLDTTAVTQLSAPQRAALDAMYWAVHDPVVSSGHNELLVEFTARVVQAELRFTDDELGLRGADTDRGDVFVRYGPPDKEMTVPGTPSVQQDLSPSTDVSAGGSAGGGMISTSQFGGTALAWIYNSKDVFFFDMSNGFGTARTPLTDQLFVTDVATVKPTSWDNLALPRWVDTLVVRTTRFRANADSTDVVIATAVPIASLSRDVDLVGADVAVDVRVIDGAARTRGSETSHIPLDTTRAERDPVRSWVRRTGLGANVVRVEALQSESRRAARSLTSLEPIERTGFGLSDILLASGVGSLSTAAATSWRELSVTPSTGTYRAGDKIGVAWEIYDLARRTDSDTPSNSYRVTLTVSRAGRSGAGAFALRVVDRLGTLLRPGDAAGDRVTVSFDRAAPAAVRHVEYVTLDWLQATRGDFDVRVDLTDLVTSRVTTRTTVLRIR